MGSEGRPTDPRDWSVEDVLALRQARRCDTWTLRVLNDFARFLGSTAVVEAGIPPRPAPTHVRWLTKPQVMAMLRAVRGDPLLELVAVLGLGQGLRRVEWQRMRLSDVDLGRGRLLVRGKGRGTPKLVEVPLHPAFAGAFERYKRHRDGLIALARRRNAQAFVPEELLVHRWTGGLRGFSLSGLDLLVHRIQRKVQDAGVSVRLSSHMFRRSGATLLEEALLASPRASKDGVYRVVQGFLRHENLATTMGYLEANPARQERALREYAATLPWATLLGLTEIPGEPAVLPPARDARKLLRRTGRRGRRAGRPGGESAVRSPKLEGTRSRTSSRSSTKPRDRRP
jgi:integrase